jgi:hypothetical protein
MADEDRTFQPTPAQGNRTDLQGSPGDDPRRTASAPGESAQLGSGTPANVDIHKTGDDDNPEADWGEAVDQGAEFSANHTRRSEKTEAERGQGAKTRKLHKDIISRRT